MKTQQRSPPTTPHAMRHSLPTLPRRDQLRLELLATVDSLLRRRADLVSEGVIEDYVALHWLEWNGGGLRLTATGATLCDQMRADLR